MFEDPQPIISPGRDAKLLILDSHQINDKIRRIAYQIMENNFTEKNIILAGVTGQGYRLAVLLKNILDEISNISTRLITVELDKYQPQKTAAVFTPHIDLKNQTVILIDDVINSARTLAFALQPLLQADCKKIEVAALVSKNRTLFPIRPTYTGHQLATTLADHVQVSLGKKNVVYLV